jgi:hypothetical protein
MDIEKQAAHALLAKIKSKPKNAFGKPRGLPFPKQDAFVNDSGRFLSALCTRRAGKSNGLARRYLKTMRKYHRCLCPYLALTRDSAKNIMWEMLKEHTEEEKIRATFTEHNLTMTLNDNGSRLQLFGADMKNFIRRLKGIKTPGAGIDEAQDFGAHLITLVDDVLTPAIIDYPDGWIAITGTPGPIPHGYFYDVTEKGLFGFSKHGWSIYDNPYIDDPKGFVDDLIEKKKWLPNNPTLLREWKGLWVLDLDAIVYKYQKEKNDYGTIDYSRDWEFVVGVDLGFDDADAIAVIGWHKNEKLAYLIHEEVHVGQTITELAAQIDVVIASYDPLKVVMDTGGLGKKIAEEMRRRYTLPIVAAEKVRKFEFIELINDAMRMGRFFAKKESRFAEDCGRLKWETDITNPEKPKISDNFHSDVCFVAGTLIQTNKGQISIDKIKIGDMVMTRQGLKRVCASGLTSDSSNVVVLEFSNGSILKCTPNHPIYTENRGWVPADTLLYADRCVISLQWHQNPQSYRQKLLNLMDQGLRDIQIQSAHLIETIIVGISAMVEGLARKPHSIERCGNSIMVICQTDFTFITKMGITSTMRFRILNAFQQKNTIKNTHQIVGDGVYQDEASGIWPGLESLQQNGINLKKVVNGTNNMPSIGKVNSVNESQLNAQFVDRNILAMICRLARSFIVQINVGQRRVVSLVKIMKEGFVSFVKSAFRSINTQKLGSVAALVRRRTPIETVSVYNISVEECPEYFANGILVHNCDAVLYAYREALHWLTEPAQVILKPNTEPWYEAQAREAEQRLIEQLEREKSEDIYGDMRTGI